MKHFATGKIILILLILTSFCYGGQYFGGNGYLHTNSALGLKSGTFDVSLFARGFAEYVEPNPGEDKVFISDLNSAFAISFGYGKHLGFGLSQILYQDLNQTNTFSSGEAYIYNGDTNFRLLVGNFHIRNNVYFALIQDVRLRVGRYTDFQYEPYFGKNPDTETMFVFSYLKSPLLPKKDLQVHLNVSFTRHNDKSAEDDVNALSGFLLGSVIFPMEKQNISLGIEGYSSVFVNQPEFRFLGRENWAYITPFVKTNSYYGFSATFGVDVLLMGREDTSLPDYDAEISNFSNYPTWRTSFRLSYIPPIVLFSEEKVHPKIDGIPIIRREKEEKVFVKPEHPFTSYYEREKIIAPPALDEDIEDREIPTLFYVEELNSDRKEAAAELERLRRHLEAKKKKQK